VNASLLDNGNYTHDTISGLDWLDVTETRDLSYNYVGSQFDDGGVFKGWRYAKLSELDSLVSNNVTLLALGGVGSADQYDYHEMDVLITLLGDTLEPFLAEKGTDVATTYNHVLNPIRHESNALFFGLRINGTSQGSVLTTMRYTDADGSLVDAAYYNRGGYVGHPNFGGSSSGSFLVREVAPVPVPSAIILLGSGLIGLIGAKRKHS